MPYKRPNQGAKRFLPVYGPKKPQSQASFDINNSSGFFSIPLPNEREAQRSPWNKGTGLPSLSRILDFLREHIGIEEIILIGIIILLIDEAIEDELLLIVLVYILLF